MKCKRLPRAGRRIAAFGLVLLALFSASGVSAAYEEGQILGFLELMGDQLTTSGRMCGEVPLGDLAADAVREQCGADIAIVNAGDMTATHLIYGDVSWDRICASFVGDRTLATAEVTIPELCAILENAVASIILDPETEAVDREASASEAFVQISGFRFTYDASAPVGERVTRLLQGDSVLSPNDSETRLRLAATRFMLEGGYGMPVIDGIEDAGLTLAEAQAAYFLEHGRVSRIETGRITAIGTTDNKIISYIPIWGVFLAMVFFTFAGILWKKKRKYEE